MTIPTTNEEIIAAVDAQMLATQALRDRWNDHWEMWRIEKYELDEPKNRGFRTFTSTQPRSVADKVHAWLTGAKMSLQIPHDMETERERREDDVKERFFRGCEMSANERLRKMMLPALRELLAWYIPIRGWYALRCTMNKRDDGATYVEIMPWDPLNTAWSMGDGEPEWACHRTFLTKSEIVAQYPDARVPADHPDTDLIKVYDFWTGEDNIVLSEHGTHKPWTRHFSPAFPVVMGNTGGVPHVQTERATDTIKDVGPSIYMSMEKAIKEVQELISVDSELVHRARKPPIITRSADGTFTLEHEIFTAGSTISALDSDQLEVIAGLETTRDFQPLLGYMLGELQRTSLPNSTWGELGFTLSGFAINQLSQGIQDVLNPLLKTMEEAYKGVFDVLCAQYATGRYEDIRLVGYTSDNLYFDETISVRSMEKVGKLRVQFHAELPRDDTGRMANAQIAREGPVPLLPDRRIWDDVLKIEDSDNLYAEIMEQQASRALPQAQLYEFGRHAAARGRMDLANIYLGQLRLMYQQLAAGVQGQPPPESSPAGGGGNGAGPGFPPQALPNAALGINPAPTPQPGANQPPGAARPGARNGTGPTPDDQFAALGLTGPA